MENSNVFTIVANEELVEKLERANAKSAAMKTALTQFIDSHALDPDASAVTSPVAIAFTNMVTNAELEYNQLKQELSDTYFDKKKCQPFVINWNLDFATSIVTITMRPGYSPILVDGCGTTVTPVD